MNAFLSKGLKRLIRQERPLYAIPRLIAETATHEGTLQAASQVAQAATSGVLATAVDAAIFAADELGVAHPSPTPILQSLPVPMKSDMGHGMPSSHAMSLFYFATYLSIAAQSIYLRNVHYPASDLGHPFIQLMRRLLPDPCEESWDVGYGRTIVITTMFTLVAFECYTRIRRRFHTWQQITVGAILGSIVGFVHYHYVMPAIREASRDIPPLSDRSPTFIASFTLFMTSIAALTLERNTQRVAKKLARSMIQRFQRAKNP